MQSESIQNDSPTPHHSVISPRSTVLNYQKENGLSQAVFLARIFPSLVKALGWQVADQDYGSSMPALLASYDRDTQSWRTSERSLFEDLGQSLDRLPKSGMMRNGKIYALPMSERPIGGNESGLLPTPCATLGTNGGPNQRDSSGRPGLQMAAMMWPTPDCQNHRDGSKLRKDNNLADGGRHGVSLHHAVTWSTSTVNDAKNSLTDSQRGRGTPTANMVERLWPTPRTAGMCGGTGNWNQLKDKCENIEEARKMGAGNGGQLNPHWVAWLMGYPLAWADLRAEYAERCPSASPSSNASVTR